MSTTSTFSTSNSQRVCDCGLPTRILISRTQQNPEKRFTTCPNSLHDQNAHFGNGLLKIRLPMNLKELVGLRKEVNDMKKKMRSQKAFFDYFVGHVHCATFNMKCNQILLPNFNAFMELELVILIRYCYQLSINHIIKYISIAKNNEPTNKGHSNEL
ncbi:hypothetical protein LXL04_021265 [Taraxacum kok-saghyz]